MAAPLPAPSFPWNDVRGPPDQALAAFNGINYQQHAMIEFECYSETFARQGNGLIIFKELIHNLVPEGHLIRGAELGYSDGYYAWWAFQGPGRNPLFHFCTCRKERCQQGAAELRNVVEQAGSSR